MDKVDNKFIPFEMGIDANEAIIHAFGSFMLVKKGEMFELGSSKEQARENLKKLGKDTNFPQFIND